MITTHFPVFLPNCELAKAILDARAEIDKEYHEKYVHFFLGRRMISFQRNEVLICSNSSPWNSEKINQARASNSKGSNNHALLYGSVPIGQWDGECIFDLIKVFQKTAKILKLSSLLELLDFLPIALQSGRLEESYLKSNGVGVEFSKFHPFYIDKKGRALVAVCSDNERFASDRSSGVKRGFYVLSSADLVVALYEMRLWKSTRTNYIGTNTKLKVVYKNSNKMCFVDIDTPLCDVENSIACKRIRFKWTVDYGFKPKQLKRLLLIYSYQSFVESDFGYGSGVSLAELSDYFERFLDDKYLVVNQDSLVSRTSPKPFHGTVKAGALTQKKPWLRRMDRIKLKEKMALVEKRYLNAFRSHEFMYQVPVMLGYFGSAINPDASDYGDLDVLYSSTVSSSARDLCDSSLVYNGRDYTYCEIVAYSRILNEKRLSGCFPMSVPRHTIFRDIIDYSDEVVMKYLKANDQFISIHDHSEVLSLGTNVEIHYIMGEKISPPITDIDVALSILKDILSSNLKKP